jgi:uncharacterized membrane protein
MMIHPATAHFAMVLPVVASVFGLAYMISKSESMSKISSRTTVFAALAMIAAWYTGDQAGQQIIKYLSEAGKHELLEHKQLGFYLAIALSIIAVLKVIGCKMKSYTLEVLAIILLLGATATTFLQGKHGGEVVYNYGMPFKAHMMESTLDQAVATAEEAEEDDEKVEAYEDAIDEIKSMSEEIDAIYGNKPKEESESEDEE